MGEVLRNEKVCVIGDASYGYRMAADVFNYAAHVRVEAIEHVLRYQIPSPQCAEHTMIMQ